MIKSIMQEDWDHCYFDGCENMPSETHHVLHGANRRRAKWDKLMIHVCMQHHYMIHFDRDKSGELDRRLKREAQKAWQKNWLREHGIEAYDQTGDAGPAKRAWMERYGRNYL